MSLRAVFERREDQRARMGLGDRLRDLVRNVVTAKRMGRRSKQRDRVQGAEMVVDGADGQASSTDAEEGEPSDDDETDVV